MAMGKKLNKIIEELLIEKINNNDFQINKWDSGKFFKNYIVIYYK